jgi:hypothetical protein
LPLLARTWVTWHTLVPPGASGALWLRAYEDLFRYLEGPSFATWRAAGLGAALQVRGGALSGNLGVLGQPLLYVAAPLTLLGAWRGRRSPATWVPLIYLGALYVVMSLVFPLQGVRGGLFHSLAALLPWVWLWTVDGLEAAVAWAGQRRAWPPGEAPLVFGVALVAFGGLASLYFTASLTARWDAHVAAYQAAAAWLAGPAPPEARAMSADPAVLWYASTLGGSVARGASGPAGRSGSGEAPSQTDSSARPPLAGEAGRGGVVTPSDGFAALVAAAVAYDVDYVLVEPAGPTYLAPVYAGEAPAPDLLLTGQAGPIRIYRVAPAGPSFASHTRTDAVSSGGSAASSSAAVFPSRG